MTKVVSLKAYRARLKRDWIDRHQKLILSFIVARLASSSELNEFVARASPRGNYLDPWRNLGKKTEISWDYQGTRDLLHDYLNQSEFTQLYEALSREPWFQKEKAPEELILELTLTFYMHRLVS